MQVFELLLVLLALSVALAVLARRWGVPPSVALVLGGMALAFVPALPPLVLDPELALALFLPPLLQASAYRTDWSSFRSNLRPILLLAIGAVFFTAGLVAVTTKLFLPSLPWWAAITLGAIVAPPDAVAAASVLGRFRLPKRIVTVLEGESLINDASSLVLYRFAVAAVGAGTVSYGLGGLQFAGVAIGGAATGWLVGRIAMWVFARLEDTLLDLTISILAGFAAYLAAEAVGASGVLAAVACGCVLGRQQHGAFTARTRIALVAVWGFVEFVLTSLVFILIGLQLRGIVARLADDNLGELALLAAVMSATLVAGRFAWVFASAWLPRAASRALRRDDLMPPWRHSVVVAWTGMRGVVSLSAALALPEAFPARDTILFLAFCSIFVTLVLQGTTLGWLVRRLGVVEGATARPAPETTRARADIATASLDAVKRELDGHDGAERAEAAAELVREYEVRADRASIEGEDWESQLSQLEARQRLRLVAIGAAREELAGRAGTMDVAALRALGAELDLEEQRIRHALKSGRQRRD